MAEDYLTAEQARNKMLEAQSINGPYLRAETTALLKRIDELACAGKNELTWGRLDEVMRSRLSSLGYKIKWYEGDQRDPGYTTISW